MKTSTLLFALTVIIITIGGSDSWTSLPRNRRLGLSSSLSMIDDSLKQQPYESNGDYMKRLAQAAASMETPLPTVRRTADNSTTGTTIEAVEETKPTPKYVRAEDWDAQYRSNSSKWENQVMFDGQRFGNRFNQNEILRKNLKGF